jgi:hypothetical protein
MFNQKLVKMRKIIAFAIILAAFTTSCSNDEQGIDDAGVKTSKAIGFKTFVDNTTRGTPIDTTVLRQDFGVFGYWNDPSQPGAPQPMSALTPNLFYNQRINYIGNNQFSYSPVVYWPNEGDVNFFAYTPYHSTNNFTTPATQAGTGYPEITYTVSNTDIAAQEDFMTAYALDLDGTVPNVNFNFQHALTKVGVFAQLGGAYPGVTVNITSIRFTNIKSVGTFNYGRFNGGGIDTWWNGQTTPVTYPIGLASSSGVTVEHDDDYDFGDGDDITQINAANQYLLAIPQSFTGTGSTSPQLLVNYTIMDGQGVTNNLNASFDLSQNTIWSPGYYVVYLLKINLNLITFSASVAPWRNSGDQNFVVYPQ